jgi:hypothetical protein
MYKYISGYVDFIEAHTALDDSIIEAEILKSCVLCGADLTENYTAFKSIPRTIEKTLHIKTVEQTDYYFDYEKIRINKDKTEITLK